MSPIVTCEPTYASDSAKPGRWSATGVSHVTVPWSIARAMTLVPTDFETDASAKTVSGSTGSPLSTSLTP
ncbi:hypothetical protein [Microbacterium sp. 4R-513]|uniref:hypothetical protein n=1 Tax=Microbacterium sp. 4R-513 TaxID=2567934 RepID=UPI0019D2CD7B|nr:hypothetical protein [Microbacterium sp. 4R-513]